METRSKRVRKVMFVQPTFDSIENQYDAELMADPGPGMVCQATEFVLSPFYTRPYDEAMQETAQQEALAGGLQPVPPATAAPTPGPTGPPGPSGSPGAPGAPGRDGKY